MDKKKKVLLTGGSHSELPMIRALHEMGYFVITTGNNPEGLGHAEADLYEQGDFSNKEFVLELAKKHGVSGIVSGCNDFAYLSTAYACEKLGLPGPDSFDTAMLIHHKDSFRGALRASSLPLPESLTLKSEDQLEKVCEKLGFPMMIKPVDLTGGKGIRRCDNLQQAKAAFKKAMAATREDHLLAEQFIEGENHGASLLIRDGKVCFAFFDNEEYYLNPYLVSGAHYPADLGDGAKAEIIRQTERLAQQFILKDGLFHCQCITTRDKVYLIDPCRRAPGDLYLRLVELATGVDYSKAIVSAELGLGFDVPSPAVHRFIARECLMSQEEGFYEGIRLREDLRRHLIEKLIWGRQGELIQDRLKYKAGILFFEFQDVNEMKNALTGLYDKMQLRVRSFEDER